MKKISLKCSRVIASLAFIVTFINVNSTCMFLVHQPELPKSTKMLSKF